MSWENNVHDNPEKFGLEIFDTLYDPYADYSFDTIVVFRDPITNDFFWARDSGCSCPSPFEDYEGRDDLTELVSHADWSKFVNEVEGHGRDYNDRRDDEHEADKVTLLGKLAIARHWGT